MKKMPTLFERDWGGDRSRVTQVITPGCEWVLERDGTVVVTRKWDGTCVWITAHGSYLKRYDAKHGKTPPDDFIPAQMAPDPNTGHWPGWVPVGPNDKWHLEALAIDDINVDEIGTYYEPGTYELCGPKIGGNPEQFDSHLLLRHGLVKYDLVPRSYGQLRDWLATQDIEGIVFYQGAKRAKLKKSDMGLPRKVS